MLRSQRQSWPLVGILVCLLVVGVTAPGTWKWILPQDAPETALPSLSDNWLGGQVFSIGDSTRRLPAPSLATGSPLADLSADPWPDGLPDAPVLAEVGPRIGELRWSVGSDQGMEPSTALPSAGLPLPDPGLIAPWSPPASPNPGWGEETGGATEVVSPLDVRRLGPPPLLANAPSLVERVPARQAPSMDRVDRSRQPAASAGAPARRQTAWRAPSALLAQLEAMEGATPAGSWAKAVATAVNELGAAVSGGNVREALARISALSAEADGVLAGLDEASAPQMRAAADALRRRLQVWNRISALGWPEVTTIQPPPPNPEHLALAVERVSSLTGEASNGQAWSEYLMLDALRDASVARPGADADRRKLARRVVLRVLATSLTPTQHQFLRSEPLTSLGSELRRWATEPIGLGEVLEHLEQYEQTSLPSDARRLAADCQALGISMVAGQQQLSDTLDTRYRGANLRVTVTEELLNRLMPKLQPEYAPVRDTILGQRVHGNSLTESAVAVRMIPDPNRARLALEVTGDVSSLTSSTSGPATFFSNSNSTYLAQKPIEIGVWGLQLSPAEVSVDNFTRLRALRTQFDAIPLVGSMVKNVARARHDESVPAMQHEVEGKVARRAKQRVDTEADARLGAFSKRLEDKILKPLLDLAVKPVMLDARTTEERFTLQLRLAGDGQLGGHTPRPEAPADSLTSFQVHQSALNNFLEGLALDGRTFTTAQLREHLAKRLNRPEILDRELRHDDVTVTFAAQDAILLRCDDGRVAVTLSVTKLRKPPHVWRNFQVRAFYRPQLDGLSVQLVRDGVVQLIGQRLDTSDQIALRGVFSKVFIKDQAQSITPEAMVNDPRLAGLGVTQCVLRDGWIGVAIGPERRGSRSLAANREAKLAK